MSRPHLAHVAIVCPPELQIPDPNMVKIETPPTQIKNEAKETKLNIQKL